MNDLVVQSPKPSLPTGGIIRPIVPQDFDGAWRIGLAVVKAGMAPRGLETAEKCTVAILAGLEVGLTPMAALQSIAVIGNRPALWGDGALGVCRASPLCEYVREWHEGADDNFQGVCEAKRRGDEKPVIRRFSVHDAKIAGLWEKRSSKGEPTPWVTYPNRMLQMRARAFALRDAFPDVLKGIGIAEEIADIPGASLPAPDPQPQKPPRPPVPKPPAPGKLDPKPIEPPPSNEDPFPGDEPGTPVEPMDTDFMNDMRDRMAEAKDIETVEEIWNECDPMARFEDEPWNQRIAVTIRTLRLRQITGDRS
jgi:hypothetical protein